MNKILITIVSILFLGSCGSYSYKQEKIRSEKTRWVDSIYNGMSIKEKVGQLFMVPTYSNRKTSHTDSIRNLIEKHKIGGLIFFQGGPVRQAKLTNQYQSISKAPLFIGIDGEWGLNMRLDSTSKYPYNMTLGAIQKNDIVKKIGEQIGKDCKRLGVHLNFAPVVDINTNSDNPIIGVRSYGENKVNVANKALAFVEGMQNQGVLACAKHFPGHGDTNIDSHKALPTVSFSKERIDLVELYPYKKLFNKGLASVMVAHLNVPSLENEEGIPSSLSYNIVSNILKERLDFKGLIFTDALNMKGASDYKEPGDIDLAAFKAGNDVLLFTENAPKAISKIAEAYNKNEITEERLSHSVKKILAAKFDVGLNSYKPIEIKDVFEDLNKDINNELYEEIVNNAITIVKNNNDVLPTKKNKTNKIAYIKLGDGESHDFFNELKSNIHVYETFGKSLAEIQEELKSYNKVIIAYHRLDARKVESIPDKDKNIIEELSITKNVILNLFASQYSLKDVSLKNCEGIIIAYENAKEFQRATAHIVLGKKKAFGKLPASINGNFFKQ